MQILPARNLPILVKNCQINRKFYQIWWFFFKNYEKKYFKKNISAKFYTKSGAKNSLPNLVVIFLIFSFLLNFLPNLVEKNCSWLLNSLGWEWLNGKTQMNTTIIFLYWQFLYNTTTWFNFIIRVPTSLEQKISNFKKLRRRPTCLTKCFSLAYLGNFYFKIHILAGLLLTVALSRCYQLDIFWNISNTHKIFNIVSTCWNFFLSSRKMTTPKKGLQWSDNQNIIFVVRWISQQPISFNLVSRYI